jgi:hypothetical protein
MRTVVLGYQGARSQSSPEAVAWGNRVLAAFAERELYDLAETFIERDPSRPTAALAALLHRARSTSVTAVAVPSLRDLGRTEAAQKAARDWLERHSGIALHVVQLLPDGETVEDRAVEEGLRSTTLHLELIDPSGLSEGVIHFQIREDTVHISWGERFLTRIDRPRFREWFWNGRTAFVADGVRLRKDSLGIVRFFVDDRCGAVLPARLHAQLRELV